MQINKNFTAIFRELGLVVKKRVIYFTRFKSFRQFSVAHHYERTFFLKIA